MRQRAAGLLAAILLAAAQGVFADGLEIAWTIPTERVDGTPLPAAEIAEYEIWVDSVLQQTVAGTATVSVIQVLPGQRCFEMRTRDTEGREGPFSPAVCKEAKAVPGAPVNVIIRFITNAR